MLHWKLDKGSTVPGRLLAVDEVLLVWMPGQSVGLVHGQLCSNNFVFANHIFNMLVRKNCMHSTSVIAY